MSKGTFLYKVMDFTGVNLVLSLFGIETHNETFTDIQVSNLLTPGKAEASARKTARHNSGGIADVYFKGYKTFQRDYRKKYSEQFMRRQGYAPSSTAETTVISDSKVKSYIENLYGYGDVSVQSAKDKYLTTNEKGRHAIQTISWYDFPTGSIIDNGTYLLEEYVDGASDTTVEIHTKRVAIESILDNLTDNYAYDGSLITVEGEQYLVGTISDMVNEYDEYETVCTHVGSTLPNVVVKTPAQRNVYSVTNLVYGSEATYVEYRVLSGEVGTELRYWIAASDTTDIYTKSTFAITAIIPMKEDNVMTDLNGHKLERMLRKLNLSGDTLKSSLENPDMDSAYLMTGINPQYNDTITNKTMFKLFDYIDAGDGTVVISISKLNMQYRFNLEKRVVSGSIGTVGTVTRVNIAETASTDTEGNTSVDSRAGMILRVQQDINEYKEIVVRDFSMLYTISGHQITTYLDSTGGYTRLLLPLDLLNSLPYKEFVWIYERSLCMLAFSVEVVEIEWYETAAFGTLLKIVVIVVAVILAIPSGGQSIQWGAVLMSAIGSMAIMYAASLIAKAIGGTLGAVIGAIVAVVAMVYFGYVDAGSSEMWLMIANESIGVLEQSIQHKMEELASDMEAFYTEMKEKIDELMADKEAFDEKHDGSGYMFSGFDSAYAGTPSPMFDSIEDYCSRILDGADMSYLVDYSAQIAQNIHTRVNVVAGIA